MQWRADDDNEEEEEEGTSKNVFRARRTPVQTHGGAVAKFNRRANARPMRKHSGKKRSVIVAELIDISRDKEINAKRRVILSCCLRRGRNRSRFYQEKKRSINLRKKMKRGRTAAGLPLVPCITERFACPSKFAFGPVNSAV